MYVIAGYTKGKIALRSIEYIDITFKQGKPELGNMITDSWHYFEVEGFIPRVRTVFGAVSETHLVVMGGNIDNDLNNDIIYIDTTTM